MAEDVAARLALTWVRLEKGSTRSAAVEFRAAVPRIHRAAGCRDGEHCRGPGCKVGK